MRGVRGGEEMVGSMGYRSNRTKKSPENESQSQRAEEIRDGGWRIGCLKLRFCRAQGGVLAKVKGHLPRT